MSDFGTAKYYHTQSGVAMNESECSDFFANLPAIMEKVFPRQAKPIYTEFLKEKARRISQQANELGDINAEIKRVLSGSFKNEELLMKSLAKKQEVPQPTVDEIRTLMKSRDARDFVRLVAHARCLLRSFEETREEKEREEQGSDGGDNEEYGNGDLEAAAAAAAEITEEEQSESGGPSTEAAAAGENGKKRSKTNACGAKKKKKE